MAALFLLGVKITGFVCKPLLRRETSSENATLNEGLLSQKESIMSEFKSTSYDEVPYESYPFAQTHPDRLATVATLLGMQPAPVEQCRVLELGCASGGNLLRFLPTTLYNDVGFRPARTFTP
jgi:hypothetical protein